MSFFTAFIQDLLHHGVYICYFIKSAVIFSFTFSLLIGFIFAIWCSIWRKACKISVHNARVN